MAEYKLYDEYKAAGPGAFMVLDSLTFRTVGVANKCPGCGKEMYLYISEANIDVPSWKMVTRHPLTLTPSIVHKECNWHGYLTAGEFVPIN